MDKNSTDQSCAAPHSTAGQRLSRIELEIPAGAEWVRVARLTVAGVASRLPFAVDAVEDIKLAVTEAINNAIEHAPVARETEARVSICIETSAEGLWVSVADCGHVEGALQAPPVAQDDELPEGGFGLLLIRSLMDEVEHQSGPRRDTVVRMFKRVPPPQPARSGARSPLAR